MQGSEEFCQKIDMKLRQSIILTLAVIFAAACAAAVLMYIIAPIDDRMVDAVRDGKNSTGSSEFLMAMAQNDDNGGFIFMDSQLSDSVFTAVICGENKSSEDMILTPNDLSVYATDTSSGVKPRLCSTNLTKNIVIPAGSAVKFSVSANVPEDFTYDNSKMSVIISAENCYQRYGLMLN